MNLTRCSKIYVDLARPEGKKPDSTSLDISSTLTEPCCALKYYPEIEICVKEQKGEQEAKRKEAQRLEDENFGTHIIGRIRTYLWNLFEYPETSREAQVSINIIHILTRT